MDIKSSKPGNSVIQECPEYHAIQTLGHPASEYNTGDRITDYTVMNDAIINDEGEETGCDSCIHFNRGNCGAFIRNN